MIDSNFFTSKNLSTDLTKANIIFIHGFHWFSHRILVEAPQSALVVWNSWGGDVYDLLPELSCESLLLPVTRSLCQNRCLEEHPRFPRCVLRRYTDRIRALPRGLIRWLAALTKNTPSYWERIDIFSGDSLNLHDRLRQSLPDFRAEWVPLGYYDLEALSNSTELKPPGNAIQIGHAAWPIDNHLETFALLTSVGADDREFLIPLNYGGHTYADAIESVARKTFSNAPTILREWLDLPDYTRATEAVGFFILNSRTAVAFGSILMYLSRGCRVFLRSENPHANFLRGMGIHVDLLEDLLFHGRNALIPLDSEIQKRNKEIIHDFFSRSNRNKAIAVLGAYSKLKNSKTIHVKDRLLG